MITSQVDDVDWQVDNLFSEILLSSWTWNNNDTNEYATYWAVFYLNKISTHKKLSSYSILI